MTQLKLLLAQQILQKDNFGNQFLAMSQQIIVKLVK